MKIVKKIIAYMGIPMSLVFIWFALAAVENGASIAVALLCLFISVVFMLIGGYILETDFLEEYEKRHGWELDD